MELKHLIKLTEKPQIPIFGDYDVMIAYGIDKNKDFFELVFANENGKAGRLEDVKNVYTNIHLNPASVVLEGVRNDEKAN